MFILEKEIKILITKDQYNALYTAARASDGKTLKQINYYFDSYDFFLNNHGLMIRIREKNDIYLMTLKVRTKKFETGLQSQEYEFEIDKGLALVYINGKKILLSDIPTLSCALISHGYTNYPESLELIGSMVTYRTKFSPMSGVYLELDRNEYLDIIDFEIECELNNNIQTEIVLKYLEHFGIKVNSEVMGKYERFILDLKNYSVN